MSPFRSFTLPILVLPVSSPLTVLSLRAKQDFAISLPFLFPESQDNGTHAPLVLPSSNWIVVPMLMKPLWLEEPPGIAHSH